MLFLSFTCCVSQIFGAIIDVALGDFHASLACATLLILMAGLFTVVIWHQPFAHAFLNRLTGFYISVNIVFYGGALLALHQAQPRSTSSADVVLTGIGVMFALYFLGELYSFHKVPARDAPAGGFGQFHVAWSFGDVYMIGSFCLLPRFCVSSAFVCDLLEVSVLILRYTWP